MPGAVFRSVMTPIEDEIVPAVGAVGEGGIVNGLYSIHIRMLDGVDGGLTGVMLLHDGRILGGDAFFYYLGTYTSANGRWKGEILNQEHTPAKSEHPIFGGHEVGIGFSGTCDEQGALLEATALAGKRSLRLTAVLKLMRPAPEAAMENVVRVLSTLALKGAIGSLAGRFEAETRRAHRCRFRADAGAAGTSARRRGRRRRHPDPRGARRSRRARERWSRTVASIWRVPLSASR